MARADSYEDRLRIWGSSCCATNWARYSFPNAAGLNGYVLQAGDKLYFRQYQPYAGSGGMELSFTDATTTRGLVNDQDGYPINADGTAGLTRYRRVDLSSLAGKTVSGVALWVENGSVWDNYYNEISLVSADGTVRPIYDRQKTISLVSEGTATNRNWQVNHFNGNGYLGWMTASHYYHGDHLSSSRLLSSVAGLPMWQATYLPYGQELNPQATINRFKFTGKERDGETGLDYFGARYYTSSLGRFTTPDEFTGGPVDVFGPTANPPDALPYADITNPQSLNKYAYTYNNPLRFTDPDGHDIKDFILGAINAVGSNGLMGAGRVEPTNQDMAEGQSLGDAISVVVGTIETALGTGANVGGLVLDATGVGVVLGVPAHAVGTAAMLHGSGMAATGASNLLKKSSEKLRQEWEAAHEKPWPKDRSSGTNQDVHHRKPRADGGSDKVRNIEPMPRKKHIEHHKDRGDFKRWGKRSQKEKVKRDKKHDNEDNGT